MHPRRRRIVQGLAAASLAGTWPGPARTAAGQGGGSAAQPILIGMDGEFSLQNSRSAQAVEMGLRCALDEIERRGGVLGGRRFELVTRDHGSIAARGIRNLREFAAMPGLLAVFAGRFSPVVLEEMDLIRQSRTLLMAPWSSADAIVDNGMQPNCVFRLSLRDSLAMPWLLQSCAARGLHNVGLLLTNTGWGRSNHAAARAWSAGHTTPRIVGTAWYNFRDTSLLDPYRALLEAGAQAVVLVANDDEAAVLVREMAALHAAQRVPILSHWGVSGGDFVRQAGPALWEVDFSVIQTFSFFRARAAAWQRFVAAARPRYGIERPEQIAAPVGVAHAYDLMHILARAVERAGSSERARVRDALEQVRDYDGLIKRYPRPFTPTRHEALDQSDLLLARYRAADGALVPVDAARKPS